MNRNLKVTTFGEEGRWYAVVNEYIRARNKRTGRPFTKHLRMFRVNDNQPFVERAAARAAGQQLVQYLREGK